MEQAALKTGKNVIIVRSQLQLEAYLAGGCYAVHLPPIHPELRQLDLLVSPLLKNNFSICLWTKDCRI
jgi:hypothetical protein